MKASEWLNKNNCCIESLSDELDKRFIDKEEVLKAIKELDVCWANYHEDLKREGLQELKKELELDK